MCMPRTTGTFTCSPLTLILRRIYQKKLRSNLGLLEQSPTKFRAPWIGLSGGRKSDCICEKDNVRLLAFGLPFHHLCKPCFTTECATAVTSLLVVDILGYHCFSNNVGVQDWYIQYWGQSVSCWSFIEGHLAPRCYELHWWVDILS